MARIYGKGQIVLPKAVRDELGLQVGDELHVEVRDGREIVMRKARSLFDLRIPNPRHDLGLSERETTDAAWEEHVAAMTGASGDK